MLDGPVPPVEDDGAGLWTATETVVGIGSLRRDLRTGEEQWSPNLRSLLELPPDAPATLEVLRSRLAGAAWRSALTEDAPSSGPLPVADVELRLPDGTWRILECRGVCAAGPDGRPAALVATVQDVTRAREETDRLRESELASRLLSATMPDAVLMVDEDGRIEDVNEQAVTLFGYRRDELVGRSVELLVPPDSQTAHREHRARWDTPLRTPMSTGGPVFAAGRDGRRIPVEIHVTTVSLDQRRIMIAFVRDVSESRRLQQQLKEATQLYSSMLDAVTLQAIIATTEDGLITVFNTGAQHLLGYDEADMLGRTPVLLHDPDELAEQAAGAGFAGGFEVLVTDARAGRHVAREWTWRTRAGETLTVSLSASAIRDGDDVVGFIFIGQDVTRRRRAELALRDSEERFRLGFDNAPVGMEMVSIRTGQVGRIMRVNPALCAFLGRTEEDLLGHTVQDIAHPDDRPLVEDQLRRQVSGELPVLRAERRYVHSSGHALWALVSASVVRPSQGEPYLMDLVEDVTARREAEAALTHRALHDPLTGLPNREMLSDHLAHALARARRSGTVVGVLFLDLDDFKKVNDSLGHEAGDECLVEVARLVRGSLRDADTAARLGGDEFVVVCEDLHHAEEVRLVVDRLQRALRPELPLRGHRVRLSASIGVALSERESTPASLMRDADAAMYAAKEHGKGRFELADTTRQARATRQLTVEAELGEALQDDQLLLHYQPCVDLENGNVVAVEALMRWQHPERGLLTPAGFLDVVEGSALNGPVGSWVLRTAIEQAAAWNRGHPRHRPAVWVNINSRQLGSGQLPDLISEALGDARLPAERLCVELTERQALGADQSVRDDLAGIRELGVQLAIDDFGTGQNGLRYLQELPVDTIKIDKSWIDGIGLDRTLTALVSSLVTLGADLDIEVVAEGVETAGQRDRLRDLGCRLAQGYLLGRPVPASDFGDLLDR